MSIDVFDFFSGCGGTSKGFSNSGLNPVFALDFDSDAALTFSKNFPKVEVCVEDIQNFDSDRLKKYITGHRPTLFSGCAPCQPFTRQNTRRTKSGFDTRRSLLSYFAAVIEKHTPDYVFVENVPGMQSVAGSSTLKRFAKLLRNLGYGSTCGVVESQSYGVPQRRKRFVLLAALKREIDFPEETHGPDRAKPHSTVREWIGHLPPIKAGETHSIVPNHRAANLSELNLQRVMATPPEGSRSDWPDDLLLDCHSKSGYTGHSDVYGRMRWDSPATGLTTRCISLSNGRFGHPEQNRAVSVREAACLQTFPEDFEFFGSLNSQAKQIGNAVPVLLAEAFGSHIKSHASQEVG